MAPDIRVRRVYDDPVPGKGQFTQPGSSYFAATGSQAEAAGSAGDQAGVPA